MIHMKDLLCTKDGWLHRLEYIINDADGNPDLLFMYTRDCMNAFEMKGAIRGVAAVAFGVVMGTISGKIINRLRKKKQEKDTEEEGT